MWLWHSEVILSLSGTTAQYLLLWEDPNLREFSKKCSLVMTFLYTQWLRQVAYAWFSLINGS